MPPPLVEIVLRMGREICPGRERIKVVESVLQIHDIGVFRVHVEEVCLMRPGGAIADRLAYDNGLEAVLQGVDRRSANAAARRAAGQDDRVNA